MSAVIEKNANAVRLHGASDALALAAGASRPAVVFCAQATEAQRLKDEIAWFAPRLSVLLLPDWETLPYDHFSPHHDLVSERLATLYRIMREDFDVALVPAATALTRLGRLGAEDHGRPRGTRCARERERVAGAVKPGGARVLFDDCTHRFRFRNSKTRVKRRSPCEAEFELGTRL